MCVGDPADHATTCHLKNPFHPTTTIMPQKPQLVACRTPWECAVVLKLSISMFPASAALCMESCTCARTAIPAAHGGFCSTCPVVACQYLVVIFFATTLPRQRPAWHSVE